MEINGELARIPDNHFARITQGGEERIVWVVHAEKEGAREALPYYIEDPSHPAQGEPLLADLGPVDLGSYESIITDPTNEGAYQAILAAHDTVPEALVVVQAIFWMRRRAAHQSPDWPNLARAGVIAANAAIAKRAEERRALLEALRSRSA